MTRYMRLCGENLYHHIYAWGNDRHPVFKANSNYTKYLKLLERYSTKFDIDIVAYALMEWHVHLFIFDRSNKISIFMQKLHGEYAQYFNFDAGRVGHVFGERFNSKIVQPNDYGLWLSRYIHRQPVEASLVSRPEDYPWTSYRQYIGLEPIGFIKPRIILSPFFLENTFGQEDARKSYEEFVSGEQDELIEWDASKESVIGDHGFVHELARKLHLKPCQTVNRVNLLLSVSNELNVTVEQLKDPHGRKERELRRCAIKIMYKKYGIKIAQIARMLRVSRLSVMRAVQ